MVVHRGVPALLALIGVLAISGICWGAETGELKLVSLGDRDAVVISVDGEALESELVVQKLRPSRLEALYKYEGTPPKAPAVVSGQRVTGLEVRPTEDGFTLVVSLADEIPTQGASIYRESLLGPGQTVLEVFSAGGTHGPFKTAWLEDGQ